MSKAEPRPVSNGGFSEGMMPLDDEMRELLRTSLSVHRPDLLYLVDPADATTVDERLGNDLRDAVGLEFIRRGLEDDEPNELGIKLEALIDQLGRLYIE